MSNQTETKIHHNPIELFRNRYWCQTCKSVYDKAVDYHTCPVCGAEIYYRFSSDIGEKDA